MDGFIKAVNTKKDGIVIQGHTTRSIDKTMRQTAEEHPGIRQGISTEDVKKALMNAESIQASTD